MSQDELTRWRVRAQPNAGCRGHQLLVEWQYGMQIQVRYFAALREAIGRERETLEVSEPADVAAARVVLADRYPAVAELLPRCVAAVNRAYVAPEYVLHAGDELAFIPPLGGGTQ